MKTLLPFLHIKKPQNLEHLSKLSDVLMDSKALECYNMDHLLLKNEILHVSDQSETNAMKIFLSSILINNLLLG